MIVKTTELAKILDITPERIYHLSQLGKIPQEGRNQWDVEKVKEALAKNLNPIYMERKKARQGEPIGERVRTTSQMYETWRLTKERADLAELERKQQEGSLTPTEKVRIWNGGIVVRAAEILQRIPHELRDRLAHHTDPVVCGELLERELNRVREELSQFRIPE